MTYYRSAQRNERKKKDAIAKHYPHLGAKHLVFPISIALVASMIALVMLFSNEKRVVVLRNVLSSNIFGKNIETSTKEMQFLLTVQVEDMAVVELYKKLRDA